MKIGIVNPYFNSMGGGERYMLSIASHLAHNHAVDIFWDDKSILESAEKMFNIHMQNVSVVPNIFAHGSFIEKIKITSAYDVIFFLTDGSIPTSFAKHSVLHIQVPFEHINMPFWKKWRFDAILYNSQFTKDHIDQTLNSIPGYTVYPPVTPIPKATIRKEKLILSVGRFGGHYNAKKFNVLINAFEKFVSKKQFSGYSLALAGGVLPKDEQALESLKKLASKLPVTFHPNCIHTRLISLYQQATIYLHAAGFGEIKPENMEHFGIAPVEAMSAGAVPFVYNGGGLPEVISEGKNGYLWNTVDELVSKMSALLQDPSRLNTVSEQAVYSSFKFSNEIFNKNIDTALGSILEHSKK